MRFARVGVNAAESVAVVKGYGQVDFLPKLPADTWLFGNEQKVDEITRHFKYVLECGDRIRGYGCAPKACYLLAGPVGSGKTTAIRYIASVLNLSIHVTSLTKFSADSCQLPPNSLLVVEDVHVQSSLDIEVSSLQAGPETMKSAYHPRDIDHQRNEAVKRYVNRMSEILQTLDGLDTPTGLLCIFTANLHLRFDSSIDAEALLRPLRLRCLTFDYPSLGLLSSDAPEPYRAYLSYLQDHEHREGFHVNVAQLKECIVLCEALTYGTNKPITKHMFLDLWNRSRQERDRIKSTLSKMT
jgi:energy-coupling factor transporter ATP-binding protein EcfA2